MTAFVDTFDEAADTALESHTSNSGHTWTVAQASASITVVGGAGYGRHNTINNGNRYNISSQFERNEYDIEATFIRVGGQGFFGIRHGIVSATASTGLEWGWDNGNLNGPQGLTPYTWNIGDTHTLRVQRRAGVDYCYIDGVLTQSGAETLADLYHGLLLGSFSGGSDETRVLAYQVNDIGWLFRPSRRRHEVLLLR